MHQIFLSTLLLPLAFCLPPFIKQTLYHAPSGAVSIGQKSIDLSQFSWDDYVLSGVSLDCNRESPNEKYGCTYKFHWDDPNYDNSMNCDYTFSWDGVTQIHGDNNSYPTGYQTCGSYWSFKFEVVRYVWNFNMTIKKLQKDSTKFGQNSAWFFAYPNITLEKIGEVDFHNLLYATIDPVKAKIQGVAL